MSTPLHHLTPPDEQVDLDSAIDQLRQHFQVPSELNRRMVNQESGGNVNAVSPLGAHGAYQVMPATLQGVARETGKKLQAGNPLHEAYAGLYLLKQNYDKVKPYAKSERHAWMASVAGYHGPIKNVLDNFKAGGDGIPDQGDGAINTRDHVYRIFKDTKPEDFATGQMEAPGPPTARTSLAPTAPTPSIVDKSPDETILPAPRQLDATGATKSSTQSPLATPPMRKPTSVTSPTLKSPVRAVRSAAHPPQDLVARKAIQDRATLAGQAQAALNEPSRELNRAMQRQLAKPFNGNLERALAAKRTAVSGSVGANASMGAPAQPDLAQPLERAMHGQMQKPFVRGNIDTLANQPDPDAQLKAEIRAQVEHERGQRLPMRGGVTLTSPIDDEVERRVQQVKDTQAEQQRLLAQFTPSDFANMKAIHDRIVSEPRYARAVDAGLANIIGGGATKLAGAIRLLLPATNISEQMAGAQRGISVPGENKIADTLARVGQSDTQAASKGRQEAKFSRGEATVQGAVELGGNLAEMMLLSKGLAGVGVPAGAVGPTTFGVLGATEAAGENKSALEVAKRTGVGVAEGVLYGAAHDLPGAVDTLGQRLARTATQAGLVGGGTKVIEDAAGATPEQSNRAALTNAAFVGVPALAGEAVGGVGRGLERRAVRGQTNDLARAAEESYAGKETTNEQAITGPVLRAEAGAVREIVPVPASQPEPFSEGERAFIEQARQNHIADEEIQRREHPSGFIPTVFDVQKAARAYRQQQQAATQSRRARNTKYGKRGQFNGPPSDSRGLQTGANEIALGAPTAPAAAGVRPDVAGVSTPNADARRADDGRGLSEVGTVGRTAPAVATPDVVDAVTRPAQRSVEPPDGVSPSPSSSNPVAQEPTRQDVRTFAELDAAASPIGQGEVKESWQQTRDEYARNMARESYRSSPLLSKNEVADYEKYWARRHYDAVGAAVAEGKPVPPEVLADYPDLQKSAPAPAQPKTVGQGAAKEDVERSEWRNAAQRTPDKDEAANRDYKEALLAVGDLRGQQAELVAVRRRDPAVHGEIDQEAIRKQYGDMGRQIEAHEAVIDDARAYAKLPQMSESASAPAQPVAEKPDLASVKREADEAWVKIKPLVEKPAQVESEKSFEQTSAQVESAKSFKQEGVSAQVERPLRRIVQPTKAVTRTSAKVEKVDPRTGLKPTQGEYLAGELRKGVDKLPLVGRSEAPLEIKVPGDGEFTLYNRVAASSLHKKVSGAPLEGVPIAADTGTNKSMELVRSVMRGRKPPRTVAEVDKLLESAKSAPRINLKYVEALEQKRQSLVETEKLKLARLTPTERASYEQAKSNLKRTLSPNKVHDINEVMANALPEVVKIAKYHILNGAREFADFSREMVKQFGEQIRPHLERLHKLALEAIGEKNVEDNTARQVKALDESDSIRSSARPQVSTKEAEAQVRATDTTGQVAKDATVAVPPTIEPTSTKNAVTERERAFPKSAEAAGFQQGTDLVYDVATDKAALSKAEKTITEQGADRAMADLLTRTEANKDDIVLGEALAKKFADSGEHEREIAVIDDLSKKLTNAGQTVQAASVIAKLSPTGLKLRAQRILNKTQQGRTLTKVEGDALVQTAEQIKSSEARVKELAPEVERAQSNVLVEELQTKLDQAEAKLAEIEKGQTKQGVDRMRAEVRRTRRAVSKAELDTEFAAIKGRLTKAWIEARKSHGALAVDPEGQITKALGEMALNRVRAGVNDAAQLVDDIYNALKDDLPGLTRREVQEKVSGYGKTAEPSKEPIKATLRDLKEQMRLALAIEDVEGKQAPRRSGYQRGQSSAKALELRRELTEKLKASGMEMGTRDPLPAIKRRLQQEIDRHEETLRRGVLTPRPQRAEVKLDADATKLRTERDTLREQIQAERKKYPQQGPKLSEGMGRKAGPRLTEAPKYGPRTSEALKSGPPKPDAINREIATRVQGRPEILRGAELFTRQGMNPETWRAEMKQEFNLAGRAVDRAYRDAYEVYTQAKQVVTQGQRLRAAQKANPQAAKSELQRLVNERLDEQTKRRKGQEDLAKQFDDLSVTPLRRIGRGIMEVAGLRRAARTAIDLSWGFRQGKVAFGRHPLIWAQGFAKQFPAMKSKATYERMISERELDPDFKYAQRFKLFLATEGRQAGLSAREEGFQTSLAEKIPIISHSERAYNTMADEVRFQWFKQLLNTHRQLLDVEAPENKKVFESLAQQINIATGRGGSSEGFLAKHGAMVNNFAFSAQFWASRLKLISQPFNPRNYTRLSEPARVEAWKNFLGYALVVGGQLALAKASGANVDTDPHSANFLKATWGRLHVDFSAGVQGHVRAALGMLKSLDMEYRQHTKAPRYHTAGDIAGTYFRGKESPDVQALHDIFLSDVNPQGFHTMVTGEPVYLTGRPGAHGLERVRSSYWVQNAAPMIFNDAYEAFTQLNLPVAGAATAGALLGEGMQTYSPRSSGTVTIPDFKRSTNTQVDFSK